MTRHAVHFGSGRPAGQSRDSSGSRSPPRAVAAADVDAVARSGLRACGPAGQGCGRSTGLARLLARSLAAGPGAPPALPCPLWTRRSGRGGLRPARVLPRSRAPCGLTSWRSRRAGPAEGLRPSFPRGPESPCPPSRRPSLLETRLCSERHLHTCYSFHLLVPVCFFGNFENPVSFRYGSPVTTSFISSSSCK